jgi:hypothetical protein
MMRNTRTTIAGISARVQPIVWLNDRSCMSVTTRGPNLRFKATLIRKARV